MRLRSGILSLNFSKKYQTQSGFQVDRSELTPRYYRAETLRRPRHRRPRSTDALGAVGGSRGGQGLSIAAPLAALSGWLLMRMKEE
jgi:hypothetical protein